MNKNELTAQIKDKKSFLCIGLDPDVEKIPPHLKELRVTERILEFNKSIIDKTHDLCVAYKPNLAFYEAYGVDGLIAFGLTVEYIRKTCGNNILIIADAKRADIGNSSSRYAKAYFEHYGCDALTVAPYMGSDSVRPFLEYQDKWTILLARTSNEGSKDIQNITPEGSMSTVWKEVIQKGLSWGTSENLMFVMGATGINEIRAARKTVHDHFFLIPGVGAQGGKLEEVCEAGLTDECGILVNSSRGIIYAGNGLDYADKAREVALTLQISMQEELERAGIISSISV